MQPLLLDFLVLQARCCCKALSMMSETTPGDDPSDHPPPIKIVSVDVERRKVHSLLRDCLSDDDAANVMEGRLHKDQYLDDEYKSSGFVENTHVTMAHFSQLSQEEMIGIFGPVLGHTVSVTVTGLLWNQRIAALSVDMSPTTTDTGAQVAKPQNDFPHITLWHMEDASPSESNDLPRLLSIGEASRLIFSQTPLLLLEGTISFWGMDQH